MELNKKNRRWCHETLVAKLFWNLLLVVWKQIFLDQLDLKRFEEGYVCKGCFREVDRLYRLQKQVVDSKEMVSSKVAQTIHCYRVIACPPVSQVRF